MKRKNALAAFLPLFFLCSGLVAQTADDPPIALAKAVEGGDLAKVRALIAAGADATALVPTTDPYQRETLLMDAAERGKADMVALLLDSGAILEATDRLGRTALSYAVQKPEGAAAALFLIGKGAQTEAPSLDSRGKKTSILKAAALNGMLAVVDALAPRAGDAGKKQLAEAMRWVGAQGKIDLVEALLSRGVQPIWDDMDRSDSLVRAAGSGYLDVVIALVKRGARADSPDENATTPLMAAATNERLEVMRYLLEKGAKALATDSMGKTALAYLIGWYANDQKSDPSIPPAPDDPDKRRESMAALLDKAGAPFDLFYAIRAGDFANAKKLADSDNINSRDGTDGGARCYWSQDQWASSQGKMAGPSPLFLAVARGRLEIAKFLAEKGALIDDPCLFCGRYDFYSTTPLQAAVSERKEDMVAFLLGKGAKPSDEMLADASGDQSLGIVKLLVEKGANVNAVWPGEIYPADDDGDEGWSRSGDVLSAAVQAGPSPVVDYLRKKGAKLTRYVLAAALGRENAALARECLAAGVKADVNDLAAACRLKDTALVRDILKSGADVNGKTVRGRTPLILASEEGNFELVKLLVENGADVGIKTSGKDEETALDIERGKTENGAWEIANFLSQIPPGPGGYRIQKELSQALLKKDAAGLKRLLDAKADPRMLFRPVDGSDLSRYPPRLLDVACVLEDRALVQLLLSRGTGLDDVDKGLAYLAADGRLDLVELVLSSKTSAPDFFKDRLNQMLCIAAKTGNVQLAALAFSKGADPNIEIYGNPLRDALEHGSAPVAALLLERGADLGKANVSDYAVSRLFRELLRSGKRDTAKLIISFAGTDRNYLGSGMTCLGAAIRSGDRASFDWLLANGLDANLADQAGDTPLHAAVDSGDLSLAQALLDKGASPEALDGRGETAAMRAAAMPNRQAFLATFLKRGIKAGIPGLKGFTLIDAIMGYGNWNDEILGLVSASYASFPATDPSLDARQRLSLALMRGDYAQASSILDAAKGLVDLAPFRGRTALMGCAAHGDAEGLKRLLAKGADASIRDSSGLIALSEAARSGIREAVDLLLPRMPASPDPREEAIRQAAYAGRTEIVGAFIDAGVKPDAAKDDGPAALYLAASQGKMETVDSLFKESSSKGAKIDIDRRFHYTEKKTAMQSLTAAEAALARGFFDTGTLLIDKGARVDWLNAASRADSKTRGRLFRLFLSRAGSDEKKRDGSGLLSLAAGDKDAEAVRLLMAAGVDPTEAFNSSISTNFIWKDEEEMLALLAAKSSPEGLYSNVLEMAVERGKPKLVKALLDAGMDPNTKAGRTWWDEDGPSMFRLAVFSGYPEITRLLIAKGATDPLSPPELAFLKEIER